MAAILRFRFFSRNVIILFTSIALLVSLYSIAKSRRNHRVDFAHNLNINNKATKGAAQRPALIGSIFSSIQAHRQRIELSENIGFMSKLWNWFNIDEKAISVSERNILINWENSLKVPRIDKCRYMIEHFYQSDPLWANDKITEFYNIEESDNLIFSLLAERQRIYDYCFLDFDLSPTDVFDYSSVSNSVDINGKAIKNPPIQVDASDFQNRMYPFLRRIGNPPQLNFEANPEENKKEPQQAPLWPTIIDLTTGRVSKTPENLNKNFNKNFWNNWKNISMGNGIVTTFPEASVKLFAKQLAVLEHLGNPYPIQIVTAFTPSSEFLNELKTIVKKTEQHVYLVDASPILDPEFAKKNIVNFLNKWVAMIFNTFEQVVFLDVDVIPFVSMDYFFENEGFVETGTLFYKDRVMRTEHTFQYCVDMFHEAEPSKQESDLIGTGLKFDSTTKHFDRKSAADMAYKTFFRNLQLHHVDSGVVVIDKKNKLSGLILSFLFHLDAKVRRCVYGDKEIFWIGQLFAGQDFYIDPIDGSVIGPIIENMDPETEKVESHICATQIAHSDASDTLIWTNGGLKTCKFANSAANDFTKYPDYFKDRYGDQASLSKIYDAPLRIEGLIVPDSDRNPWLHIRECSEYVYCAFAGNDLNDPDNNLGHTINFNDEERLYFNKISELWNQS